MSVTITVKKNGPYRVEVTDGAEIRVVARTTRRTVARQDGVLVVPVRAQCQQAFLRWKP
jgi:hypothetical protein